ncbi:DUF6880 family protein [uncultured Psychrobacter sp.]|uniref:DUF6880 family protein n=1 Tax=uncultured Psychrobacter sp. TaxID=259303 RepID=UPI0034583C96
MLDDEQKKGLSKLPKTALVDFISDVQGMDKLLDKKIERLLLQSDKPKLVKKLTSTLKGLRRRRKVLNYWEYSDFVTELHYLADDVMSLHPELPKACLDLLELFIESTDSSLERVDDTKGDINDLYKSLTKSWLQVAATCYAHQKKTVALDEQDILSQAWSDKVKAMATDNDYGTKDNLLHNVDLLLAPAEIQALIEDYRYDYEILLTDAFSDDEPLAESIILQPMNANTFEKRRLETALIDLAWALSDIKMFEDIYLYLSSHRAFSQYEFDKLIRFLLKHQAFDVALRHLNADRIVEGSLNEVARLDWFIEIYRQQNNSALQLETLNAAFELDPTPTRFKQIMTMASPAEQASLRKKIYELAEQQQDIFTAIELWLEIEERARANQVAITRQEEFDNIHYTALTQWLKRLPDDTNLIRVVVYRSLLNDILENVRTLAYGHAARYYKHLVKLDAVISRSVDSYSSLNTHQEYSIALKEKHGKKYGFWERLEH